MDNLLVSFSGGETSGYMAQWLWNNMRFKYNMIFVFANTGEENEETLEFVNKCGVEFGVKIYWVEAKVVHGERVGTKHRLVDYATASRNGEPFEDVIKKYGIPNQAFPHCNRELKLAPIHNFIKEDIGWDDYYTAIGIREDEVDRVNKNRKKLKLIYPLITDRPMNKQKINFWWSQQSFRLNLKGYQGNCKTCWKKHENKLYRIAQEDISKFENFKKWEQLYSHKVIESRSKDVPPPYYFFRGNKPVAEILEKAKTFKGIVVDDSLDTNFQSSLLDESCDIYSECGIDN